MNNLCKIPVIILLAGVIICCSSCTKDIPVVTTTNVSNITQTSAVSGGNVTNNGGAEVTARGICWSITQNPTISSSKTSDGTGNGSFTSDMTGLVPNTTYYVSAYATNSEGTGYGVEVPFTTSQGLLATLTTTETISITSTAAVIRGNIADDGGGAITSRGVCWSTNPNPTTSNNITADGAGTGIFTSNLTGLLPGTIYYIRAYATNNSGTAYSGQITILTSITDADGNIYKTAAIGTQIWMKENLKTTKFKGGGTIPLISDQTSWSGLTSAGYCWFKNDAATYGGTYGALYNWFTVSTGNICPDGWRVPSDADWTALTNFLGGMTIAGGKMKEAGNTHWFNYSGISSTNESGFTGLPGAYRDEAGGFYETTGHYGFWWSSTEISSTNAWDRGLRYETNEIRSGQGYKKVGMSIRCLKN